MNRKKYIPAIILILLMTLACFPYLQHGLVYGDDYLYHLARIASIADNLGTGDFPVKIHNSMNMGYGYGSGFFYPDFFLYFPAVLVRCGVSLWTAYKCFAAVMLFCCAAAVYLCTLHITGRQGASFLSVCLYLFSEPLMTDLYGRFALGECLAFVFVPVILCGIYNLFYEEFDRPWILGAGFLGLLFSHMITLAVSLLVLAAALLIHGKKVYRKPVLLWRLFWVAAADLALSAGFWIPMLEQLTSGRFRFMEAWTKVSENVLTWKEIWIGGKHSAGISMYAASLFLFAGTAILIRQKMSSEQGRKKKEAAEPAEEKKLCLTGIWWMTAGYLLMVLSVCRPFWNSFGRLLNFIQFPWRLNLYAAAFLSMGAGILSADLCRLQNRKRTYIIWILGSALCIISIAAGMKTGSLYRNHLAGNELLDVTAYSVSNGGGEEWEPDSLSSNQLDRAENRLVLREDGKQITAEKEGDRLCFRDTEQVSGKESYLIPFVYYKGYQASYIEENGTPHRLKLWKDPETKLVKIEAGQSTGGNSKGEYTVRYAGTWLQKASYLLEGITWITCLLVWLSLRGRKKQ